MSPSSKYFLNAVNIAYTVPPGDWLYNTTLSNYGDAWYLPNIGTGGNPGFGLDASVGRDLNAAWFQEVAANDGDDGTYCRQHLIGAPLVQYPSISDPAD